MTRHDWRTADFRSVPLELPEGIPPAFRALIDSADSIEADALRRQVEYSREEATVLDRETSDPLGESRWCVHSHLVHQYPDRVLLLATGRCIGYCRYCFRRSFTSRPDGFISADLIEKTLAYLAVNPGVREILVSGGDPLTASREELSGLLDGLRCTRPDILIRLCTRAPVFAPQLFTQHLIQELRSLRPLWVIPHINHPAELGPDQRAVLTSLIDAGIPVQSQTVLLKGVNDDPAILERLFHSLVVLGVKPGYLFQCDMAPGTAHFRCSLPEAARIWRQLRLRLSGLSLPVFAVDLPGGGGKYPLAAVALEETCPEALEVLGIDGKVYRYEP